MASHKSLKSAFEAILRDPLLLMPRAFHGPPLRRPLTISEGSVIPNVFCVGAPKSGTSYLYSVLRKHPRISVAPKDDGNLHHLHIKGPREYLAEYARKASINYCGETVLCDFQAGHMIHPGGAAGIRDLNPDARLLFCLRDPVRRALSEYRMRVRQYSQTSGRFVETENFLNAIRLERERQAADQHAYNGSYAYMRRGQYFQQLVPYYEKFPRAQIKVIILEEDLAARKARTLMDILSYLSLRDFDIYRVALGWNEGYLATTRGPKNISVNFLLEGGKRVGDDVALNDILGRVERIKIESDVPTQLSLTLDQPVEQVIRAAAGLRMLHAFEPTPDQERKLFEEYFAEDTGRLENLIRRDLSCWYHRYS